MKRYLPFFFFFLFSSTSLFSQNAPPRKPQIKKLSASTAKAGDLIDVNAPGYYESTFTMEQLVKDVLISSGTNSCITPSVSNVVVTPNLPASNANRAWGVFP
ncbi:MAG: hypothetical protein WCJ72_16495 [Chryseobacterium sp.]